jgi:phage tail sheath protein FI
MPITTTFPGLYIEELASNAHTIIAAPTSVTVIVGYTHPFKTPTGAFGAAVELFSFADYERAFGGLFASGMVDNSVPYAVNQFFLNGGADCWVVGLKARARDGSGADLGALPQATATIGSAVFTSLELTDRIPMFVTIDNLQNSDSVADVTIFYGPQAETYRGVTLNNADDNFIETRINGVSSLVTVAPSGAYGPSFTGGSHQPFTFTAPGGFATTFSTLDYIDIFQQDTSLDKVQIFNLLIMPGVADKSIWSAALAFCERKHAFAILDPPRQAAADDSFPPLKKIADLLAPFPTSTNAGLYFPYLLAQDPLTNTQMELPPSGSVAGIFARIDQNRGVWKAPAGLEATVNNTSGVVDRGQMTDQRHGTLNPIGVNCLREFSGAGTVVFGARTTVTANTAFQQWWYVPVRRMALFLEQSLLANLKWVVFEPNDDPLWTAIRTTIENFMLSLFNQGAFQGSRPSQAFKVICDSTTTTQDDIDRGVVNIVVAFAPLKPAEFVIIKIAQLAGQTQS